MVDLCWSCDWNPLETFLKKTLNDWRMTCTANQSKSVASCWHRAPGCTFNAVTSMEVPANTWQLTQTPRKHRFDDLLMGKVFEDLWYLWFMMNDGLYWATRRRNTIHKIAPYSINVNSYSKQQQTPNSWDRMRRQMHADTEYGNNVDAVHVHLSSGISLVSKCCSSLMTCQ